MDLFPPRRPEAGPRRALGQRRRASSGGGEHERSGRAAGPDLDAFFFAAGWGSGVGAEGLHVAGAGSDGEGELAAGMGGGAVGAVEMISAEQSADIRGAVFGAGPCPVDEEALSADGAADVADSVGGLTENLH